MTFFHSVKKGPSSLALFILVVFLTYTLSSNAQVITCNRRFGYPLNDLRCRLALSNLPRGNLPSIFTTAQSNIYKQVPLNYRDSSWIPTCMITIDLDGHSRNDVFVSVSWDNIRLIAADLIERCVDGFNSGGMSTYGVHRSFEGVINAEPYDPSINPIRVEPVDVVNPDGSIDSVAVPEGHADGINIPLYLTVTVSGPRSRPSKDLADVWIGIALHEYIEKAFDSHPAPARTNQLIKALVAFPPRYYSLLSGRRWWELFLPRTVDPDPNPIKTKITCAATLGRPSTANCESAILELSPSGPVTLDPISGPIIQTSGNCAIGIEATSKQTTTWEMIRGVAEAILATCIHSPVSDITGGFAVSRAFTNGLPKRQAETTLNFTISMYLQGPSNGPPSDTCAWKVVSSHTGDVRQCPASIGPWRPPDRRLGENGTSFAQWRDGTETVVKVGNLTEAIVGNFTALTQAANLSRADGYT